MAEIIQHLLFNARENQYQYRIYLAGSSIYLEDFNYDSLNPECVSIEIDIDEWEQISNFINNEIKNIYNEI